MDNEQKCPVTGKAHGGTTNRDWWPNQLNLRILQQHPLKVRPDPVMASLTILTRTRLGRTKNHDPSLLIHPVLRAN